MKNPKTNFSGSGKTTKFVSIVIPTYQRVKSLEVLLTSIARQSFPNEIVIVEQEIRNEPAIKRICRRLHLRSTYLFLRQKSVTHAINDGVRVSRGDIILLLDDDVIPSPGLLRNHVNNYSDPGTGAVSGRVVTEGVAGEDLRTDTGRITPIGTFTDGYSSRVRQTIDSVIGCNVSFRKSAFDKTGGMDENFTQNAIRFEADFSLKLRKAGYTIVFDPLAEVTHVRAPGGGTRMLRDRREWYFHFFSNELYFFLKHRPVVFLVPFFLSRVYWILRCISRFRTDLDPRYLLLPFLGFYDGLDKIRKTGPARHN